MQAILFIAFFLVVLGSLTITHVAIIQILSNDFKGSKVAWILTSMIAVAGPILWLTKGRKLIVRRTYEERHAVRSSFSSKSHYKELIQGTDNWVKALALLSIGLIAMGYLVRAFDLYFFWESTSIGFVLLLIAVAFFFWRDIQSRKEKKVQRVGSNIGLGLICLILFVEGVMMAALPNSDAYAAAKKQLRGDVELTSEIGEIKGFAVLPSGGIQIKTDDSGTHGTAALQLIIKGTNKYVDRTVFLELIPLEGWMITGTSE